jgi:hypothetical protein
MRALLLALPMMLVPAAAFAKTDIGAVSYSDCAAKTHGKPEYKSLRGPGRGRGGCGLE